jgi:hypothetical protein
VSVQCRSVDGQPIKATTLETHRIEIVGKIDGNAAGLLTLFQVSVIPEFVLFRGTDAPNSTSCDAAKDVVQIPNRSDTSGVRYKGSILEYSVPWSGYFLLNALPPGNS